MKGVLFASSLMLLVLSACSPSAGPVAESTKPVSIAFGTSIPPGSTYAPSPTFAPNMEQTISIEYGSVAEALIDLKTHEDAAVVVRQGWTMIIEADGYTTWTFTPPDHPANPTVAKRILYQDQDGWHIAMRVHCEADQTACDDFVRQFDAINKEMLTHLEPQK